MKMYLSLSVNASERALDMMRACGVLNIPKPTAPQRSIKRQEAEIIAKGIYKISQKATPLSIQFLPSSLIDDLNVVINWGYRTIDSAAVSYLLDKINPQLREACYEELAHTLQMYGFTGYDRKRLSFLASYAGVNKMKKVAICMMASLRGGVSLDPKETDSDIMADTWDSIPVVPDYLFCYQQPILSSMSPSVRSMLDDVVARVTGA